MRNSPSPTCEKEKLLLGGKHMMFSLQSLRSDRLGFFVFYLIQLVQTLQQILADFFFYFVPFYCLEHVLAPVHLHREPMILLELMSGS